MKKSCKKGYYYCFTSKKCKKIPAGYHVMGSGRLMKDSEHEEKEGGEESTDTTKNGNGNGNGGNGNGGAVSEGWSEKYKKSIDCKNPKGFSQRAHCQGRKVNEAKEKGDHEVSMAKKQVEKSADNLKKLAKVLSKKTDKDNLPAWVQAKITNAEHDTDAAASYMEEGKRDGKSAKDKGYSLRDWFKGGGWVQAGGKYDGKPCAKQKGQKTKPFCRDADDRANMSKKERNRRAAKKRREDPNPNRKGKAKMVREAYDTTGTRFEKMKGDPVINALKATKEFKQMKGELVKTAPVKLANSFCNWRQELELSEEGKKDACYHKVKSRYSVWPSAYASGALVKCRKAGAANWGNSTRKEGFEFSNWRDDFQPTEFEATDLITPDPIQVPPSNLQKIEEKCWDGYTQKGMKKKGGKMVPNCVKEGYSNWREELAEDWQKVNKKDKTDGMSQKAVDAYKRENPGSKLKTAVTEKKPKGKRAKRRKSFCARSDGQRKMHNIDCKKTPDKAICKARRRWRC